MSVRIHPATSDPNPELKGVHRHFELAYRTIFGFDYFISYTWRDKADVELGYNDECAREYAVKLRDALRRQQFVCFLDSDDYAKGQNWRWFGQRALQGTSRLILVLSPAIAESEAVLAEVEYFRTTGRVIVPVEFVNCPPKGDSTRLLSQVEHESLRIREPSSALRDGPTESAIGELVRTFNLLRQNEFRRRLMGATIGILLLLLIAIALVSRVAIRERDQATNQLARAEFSLGRIPFEQQRTEEALLWWASACMKTGEPGLRASLLNLIGPWSAALPRRFESAERIVTASLDSGSNRVIVGAGKRVQIWNLSTGDAMGGPMEHSGMVTTAVFHPDGQRVLTANNAEETDGSAEIRLWQVSESGPLVNPRLLSTFRFVGRITKAEFSADGLLILAWGNQGAQVYDLRKNAASNLLTASEDPQEIMTSATFSPDCRTLATTGWNGVVRFFDANTSSLRGTCRGHQRRILATAFSPDGRIFATGSEDQTVRLWNVDACEQLGTPLTHLQPVSTAGFSRNGSTLFTGGEARTNGINGEAWLWDVTDPASADRRKRPLDVAGNVSAFAFSPDGRTLLTGTDTFWVQHPTEARLWNLIDGMPVGEPMLQNDKRISHAGFTGDGRWIFTAGDDRTVRIWDTESTLQYGAALPHESHLTAVIPDRGGDRLLTVSNATVRWWDLKQHRPLWDPIRHKNTTKISRQLKPDGRVPVSRTGSGSPLAALSFDDRWILTGANDRTVRVSSVLTGDLRYAPAALSAGVTHVSWSPDAKRFLTVTADNSVQLWSAENGHPEGDPIRHADYVNSAELSPDGQTLLTCCRDKVARLFDAKSGDLLRELPQPQTISAAMFEPTGRQVFVSSGNEVRAWNVRTGKSSGQPFVHAGSVTVCALSPDGASLATAEDKSVRVWDLRNSSSVGKPLEHPHPVTKICFSPSGRALLTAVAVRDSNDRGEAFLWDIRTSLQLVKPLRHQGNITAVDFSSDGKTLLTASRDTTVQLWDMGTGLKRGPALPHVDSVLWARFSHDGTRVVTSAHDNAVRLWRVTEPTGEKLISSGQLLEAVMSLTGMQLNSNGDVTSNPGE